MRIYTLKCLSTDGMAKDPHNGELVENVTIETRECVTVSDMADSFNKMLAVMGFYAEVELVDKKE